MIRNLQRRCKQFSFFCSIFHHQSWVKAYTCRLIHSLVSSWVWGSWQSSIFWLHHLWTKGSGLNNALFDISKSYGDYHTLFQQRKCLPWQNKMAQQTPKIAIMSLLSELFLGRIIYHQLKLSSTRMSCLEKETVDTIHSFRNKLQRVHLPWISSEEFIAFPIWRLNHACYKWCFLDPKYTVQLVSKLCW